jgi:hypothetical protein
MHHRRVLHPKQVKRRLPDLAGLANKVGINLRAERDAFIADKNATRTERVKTPIRVERDSRQHTEPAESAVHRD